MPVIATHHVPLFKEEAKIQEDKSSSDINVLVSQITNDILKDYPGLVADVANEIVEGAVLETAIIKVIDKKKYHLGVSRDVLIKNVFNYMFGYGPLQPYIDDPGVTDIDGTRYDEFIIKKEGIKTPIPVNFGSEEIFNTYCNLIAKRNNGILNEGDAHCRVSDEKNFLRINVSIRPRNVTGPSIEIRKHPKMAYTYDELIEKGMMDEGIKTLLQKIAITEASVIISGSGGAGKTTAMRTFVNSLPEMERVLITEKDSEVYPEKPFCIQQRIKKENEGGRPVTLGHLVRDGLTMSLDTYVIGEIVWDEAWEAMKAAHSGHKIIASTHTIDAYETFPRLLTLCKSANVQESEKTIKELIAKSIDVLIYMNRFKVEQIIEVLGYDPDTDTFLFNQLYEFQTECEDEYCRLMGTFVKKNDVGERLGRMFARRNIEV